MFSHTPKSTPADGLPPEDDEEIDAYLGDPESEEVSDLLSKEEREKPNIGICFFYFSCIQASD